jgi:hypothetical protein
VPIHVNAPWPKRRKAQHVRSSPPKFVVSGPLSVFWLPTIDDSKRALMPAV